MKVHKVAAAEALFLTRKLTGLVFYAVEIVRESWTPMILTAVQLAIKIR